MALALSGAPTPVLSIVNGTPTTTSNEVALHFGKRHDHVLRDIEALIAETPAEFNAPNFGAVEYTDAKGERRPAYRITRDGFTLLAMGFTGKKVLTFKLAYIEAFNRMEAQLQGKPPQPKPSKPSTRAFLTVINANGVPTVHPASDVGRLLYSPDSPFTADEAGQIARMATMRMKTEALALKQDTGYGEVQKQVKALSTFQLGTLAEFAYHQLYERLCSEGNNPKGQP